jgi:hypothetical protein
LIAVSPRLNCDLSLTCRENLGNVQVYTTCLDFVPGAKVMGWVGKMLCIVGKEFVNNCNAFGAIKEIVGTYHPTSDARGNGIARFWLLTRHSDPRRSDACGQRGAFVLPRDLDDLLGIYDASPSATTAASATESPLFIAGLPSGVLQQQGFRERLPDAYNDNFQVFYKLVAH